MSASLHDDSRTKVQGILGFKKNQFHDIKLPIDRPDLKYCPRFLLNSTEGTTFPDLAWVIPPIIHSSLDLTPTLFACHTIDKVTMLCQWLVAELAEGLPWTDAIECHKAASKMVSPFHAEMDDSDHREVLAGLCARSIRYIVATVSASVGIDMTVTNVICIDLPNSVEELTQWAGRASRDGSGGMLVVYANEDLQVIPAEHRDLKTYVPPSAKGLTAVKIEHHDKVQAMVQPALVEFFNPHPSECPCMVLCRYFGDEFMEVVHCCERCEPGPLESHLAIVKDYMAIVSGKKNEKEQAG
jgi:hypothetical protein